MEGSAGLLCGTHVLCHCTGSIISLSILDALVQSSQHHACPALGTILSLGHLSFPYKKRLKQLLEKGFSLQLVLWALPVVFCSIHHWRGPQLNQIKSYSLVSEPLHSRVRDPGSDLLYFKIIVFIIIIFLKFFEKMSLFSLSSP